MKGKETMKRKRRKRRWHWSFEKAHPAVQIGLMTLGGLLFIKAFVAISWALYAIRPGLFQ